MEKVHPLSYLYNRLILVVITYALCLSAHGEVNCADMEGYKIIDIQAERLPSLNIPRAGHVSLCLDGELTVLGGHTDGFVPTPTAEYFYDGAWHTVPLVYPHDHPISLQLRSGKVLMAGGHKEPLGIDQLYSVELYDPATHTSNGFRCMDRKRAYGNALEMDDGQVVIAGNWFANDGIEMFTNVYDPKLTNAVGIKDVSFARSTPYILKISDDDAIIFSSLDERAEGVDCGVVDRLKGDAYREPFLDTWRPLKTINVLRSTNHFIGDEAKGRYEWLLPVENDSCQVVIACVKGPEGDSIKPTFSLLQTQQLLPDSLYGKKIIYSSLICDRNRKIAYLVGDNDDARIFVVAIPYDTPDPSPLTIYATEPQPLLAHAGTPILTSEGNLVFAGGHLYSNFAPTDAVIRLPLGQSGSIADDASMDTLSSKHSHWCVWIIISFLIVCTAGAIHCGRRRRLNSEAVSAIEPIADVIEDESIDKNLVKDDALVELFQRIEHLMEEENLYLDPNLKASDVAARIGSNTSYLSAAISSQRGCSFTQLLNSHRISYAQNLMRQDPDRKLFEISTLSGFSTESTFFRSFRSVTGMAPKEWLASIRDNEHP